MRAISSRRCSRLRRGETRRSGRRTPTIGARTLKTPRRRSTSPQLRARMLLRRHLKATLSLAIEILLLEENGLVDTRQEIGHLINAIVAVLGPELSPGSIFFCRCKAVIAEVCSSQETSTLLESVRFTQQLVLFAPQAVSVHSHVQSLLPTLSSKQPSLRYLAVSTLRHLIEKDPVAIIHEKIEENLFSMLDEETDSEIGGLVRATIMRLLYTSCPSCPSRWLAILRKLVLATSTRSNVINKLERSENEHINGKSEGEARLYYGEDDEDMVASTRSDPLRDKHLRYRTKVFAAECLSNLPSAVGTDPAHFDLSLARSQSANGRTPDWLVLHLQDLISLAYQISTGQFEGLQSIGVILLSIVMDKFEKIPDPEVPGHLLLEQYQAQFVSAVRSAISVSAGPLLLEAGLQLATKILRSSIISGDRVALSRMFSLISRPLNDIKDLYYPSFAEWVACKIKVRLLAAHASIKCYVYQIMREQKVIPDEYQQLMPLFSSSSPILGKYWISVLKDYTYVCFGLHSNFKYIAFLDGIQSPLVSSKVKKCLDESWPLIFRATALDAVPVIPEMDSSSDKNVEDSPKSSLESGYCMIRLEPSEFQFLWGLGLIILFQGQQVNSGKQLQPLLTHRKKKNNVDSILQEMHIMMSGEIALPVFMCLSKEMFYEPKYLTLDLCRELLQVLLHAEHSADSWNQSVTCLLSQIVQFCPIEFFEKEDFVDTATELCFKQLFIAFQSIDAASQECPSFVDLLSELSVVAETIASRMNHKMNQLKFILASMSACHELFTIASTTTVLSKIITFLQNILPCLNKCFRDETNHDIDYHTQLEMVMGTWASMLAFFSQDCTRRIHSIDNKTSTVYKLLAKMLAFCLEEAASLARLFHEKHHLGHDKDNILLFTIFKNFTKCIRDSFYDSSIQVQIIGLHVLKNIAQKDLAAKDHSFSLLFAGELFGDIFLLIQHTLKERLSAEAVVVTEECLRLLFLFHTLSQASESVSAVTVLLLEALHMVFSLSSANDSQELNQVNTSTRRLVSHLVQIPSSASQIKEAIVSMPSIRRQRFQDMIRASVTQGQMVTEMNSKGESDHDAGQDAPIHVSVHSDKPEMGENSDDDEDWDAFQSVGVNDLSDSAADITIDHEHEKYSHIEVDTDDAYTGNEMANTEEPSVPEYSEDDVNDQEVSGSVRADADSKESLEDHGERLTGCESNDNDNQEAIKEQCQVIDVAVGSEGGDDGSNRDLDDISTAPKYTTDEGESRPTDGEDDHLKHSESAASEDDMNGNDQQHLNQEHGE